jgi:hypothetical protein
MIRLAGIGVLGLGALGCGAPRVDVSGRVTYKGEPLVVGSVTFVGKDNLPVQGQIQADGRYTVVGVLIGDNRVAVSSLQVNPPGRDSKTGQLSLPGVDLGKAPAIPDHYGDPRQSGLQFKVQKGPNNYDIPLD